MHCVEQHQHQKHSAVYRQNSIHILQELPDYICEILDYLSDF